MYVSLYLHAVLQNVDSLIAEEEDRQWRHSPHPPRATE